MSKQIHTIILSHVNGFQELFCSVFGFHLFSFLSFTYQIKKGKIQPEVYIYTVYNMYKDSCDRLQLTLVTLRIKRVKKKTISTNKYIQNSNMDQ